jgi:hypothetical protein
VFHTVTSAKNFIGAMMRSPKWKLTNWGDQRNGVDKLRKNKFVRDRKIATFEYCGEFAQRHKFNTRKFPMANLKVKVKKRKRK